MDVSNAMYSNGLIATVTFHDRLRGVRRWRGRRNHDGFGNAIVDRLAVRMSEELKEPEAATAVDRLPARRRRRSVPE
jgi:hypothetical protein